MKRSIRTAIAAALASLCLCANAGAKIVIIDIPGATYVTPVSINDKGEVTGYYDDANGEHGFLWRPHGIIELFDAVGTTTATIPAVISATGEITGWYSGWNAAGGFVRSAHGTITTFNMPNADLTAVYGANRQGWSVGRFARSIHTTFRPFIRDPSGNMEEISVPGENGSGQAKAINRSRTVAGEVLIQGAYRGFVQPANGKFKLFGDPGTFVMGLNDTGTIAGFVSSQQAQSFVRTSDGTITAFVAPNGSLGTFAAAINNSGTIVGNFLDSSGSGNLHGFLRTADGTFTPFDPKDSVSTEILAINNKGAIAGYYQNKDGVPFAFAGKP